MPEKNDQDRLMAPVYDLSVMGEGLIFPVSTGIDSLEDVGRILGDLTGYRAEAAQERVRIALDRSRIRVAKVGPEFGGVPRWMIAERQPSADDVEHRRKIAEADARIGARYPRLLEGPTERLVARLEEIEGIPGDDPRAEREAIEAELDRREADRPMFLEEAPEGPPPGEIDHADSPAGAPTTTGVGDLER